MNTLLHSKKEWMKDQIDTMDTNEHIQLFNIIKKYCDKFTTTNSGVLISTDTLTDQCLEEVEKYLLFALDQRKRMEDDLKARKVYERLVSSE